MSAEVGKGEPQQEITRAERIRLAGVDKAVLAEAAAARKQEQDLARIEAEKQIKIENIRADRAAHRGRRLGMVLAGLAIVTVILAVIMAIWTSIDRDRQQKIQIEKVRQQTAQQCIREGNIWADGSCYITRRDAPAPGTN
jgi:hypothetical protein